MNFQQLGKGKDGYVLEQSPCQMWRYFQPGTVPLYQYLKDVGGDHFYTTDATEIGTTIPGVKGTKNTI